MTSTKRALESTPSASEPGTGAAARQRIDEPCTDDSPAAAAATFSLGGTVTICAK